MSGNRKEYMKLLADFSTIGMTVAFSIFIGVGIGYYLDNKVFDGRTLDLGMTSTLWLDWFV